MSGDTARRKAWWRRHRRTVVGMAILGLLAGFGAAWIRSGSARVLPTAPPAVCPMLRGELLDLLVPGRRTERPRSVDWDYERATQCFVERHRDDGERVDLSVGIVAVGRAHGESPQDQAHVLFLHSFARNRPRQLIDGLGDEAGYWLDGSDRIYMTVRAGTRLVEVTYRNTMVGRDRLPEAAALAAREVLAKL